MKTAVFCKWQQSLSPFVEEAFIELGVNSVQSTLGITEVYKTRALSPSRVIPIAMAPNLK